MATSPLDPANPPRTPDSGIGRGHGTRDLGPSDSSDSGSDIIGAGALLGDASLDSDSDRNGTGETAAAGRDPETPDGADIDADHIERMPQADKDKKSAR